MKRGNAEGMALKKMGYIATIFMLTCSFVIFANLQSWACRGAVSSGYDVEMKMVDPYSGDIFAVVTFDKIKKEGKVEMAKSDRAFKSPSTFKLRIPPVHYDISTTADYAGDVKVCLNYRAVGFSNGSALKLAHLEGDSWVKLKTTLDRQNNIVCGVAPSLSHFTIFEDPKLFYGPGFWYRHVWR